MSFGFMSLSGVCRSRFFFCVYVKVYFMSFLFIMGVHVVWYILSFRFMSFMLITGVYVVQFTVVYC